MEFKAGWQRIFAMLLCIILLLGLGITSGVFATSASADDGPTPGSLTITKKVDGTLTNPDQEFTFHIKLEGDGISGTQEFGGYTFNNGEYTFTLKNEGSIIFDNLPVGTKFTVNEDNATGFDVSWTPSSSGEIVEVTSGELKYDSKTVECVNKVKLGNIKITKSVSGTTGDTTTKWKFTITLTNKDGTPADVNGVKGAVTFTNGVGTFELGDKDWITISDLPAGLFYHVDEDTTNLSHMPNWTNQSGTIESDSTVEVGCGNVIGSGNLTVTKNVEGTDGDKDKEWNFTVTLGDATVTGAYGEMTFTNGTATFTLKHGQSKTASGLPAGIGYTVTEAEADKNDYTTSSTGDSGTIPDDSTAQATFTNTKNPKTPETGGLTVSKRVTGALGDLTKGWTFTVMLSDTSVNGVKGEMTFTNGIAEFTLKHGESLTATDLPAGITYTVTEAEANQDGYTTSATGATGTIPEGSAASASFTNAKDIEKGNLLVSKTVMGPGSDTSKDWLFTVALSDRTINGRYGDMIFHNGVANVTLRHGETALATGLPVGTTYYVTEAEADTGGYRTYVAGTGSSGVIVDGETARADYINEKQEPGSLTVTKTVRGDRADSSKNWTFTVTLSDRTINGTYGGMTFTNGVATFTLKSGESITATGLPAGTYYSVSEAEANTDGYTTTSSGEIGTITAEGVARADFVNSKETGDLTVTKVLEGENADSTKEWTFAVTLSDTSVNGTYGGMTFTNGVTTFTLKGGESITATGLPVGITYTVAEAEANQDGYKTTSTGETGTIPAEGAAEAVFTNSIGDGELTVSKVLEGEKAGLTKDWTFTVTLSDTSINGTYGSMTFVDGVATFTLKGGESITATGLPVGVTYTVAEAEANQDGYKTTSTGETGEIPAEGAAEAVFTNSLGAGDLTVTKIIEGENADPNKDWTFTVTLSDTSINGTYGGMTFVDGVATFTLKGGESLTATGLPAGISYTVTEAEANQDGYKTTSTGEVGGIPEGGRTEAVFTNTLEVGDLTVVKIIEGEEADPNKDWTFTVTLSDTTINGTYGGMTFVDGVATFTLKGGESLTATGLPAGISYTVTEAEANTDGYTTTASGDTGVIPAGGEAVATFVNRKGEETGSFAIRKRVRGEEADPNQEFHFIVTLSDPTINGQYGDIIFTNGIGEVTLKDGQYVWALKLPVGVTYTVTEVEANQDGYQTVIEGASGVVVKDGLAEARFTNYKGPGEPDEDEPWTDLPDPNVPLAPPEDNPPDNPPQTGGPNLAGAWTAMLCAAAVGLATVLIEKKRVER